MAPRSYQGSHFLDAIYPTSKALALQNTEFYFGYIQPTPMVGSMVYLKSLR